MPKSTRFIEHINSLVSIVRSNLTRNTTAHEELETALKHIHPDYYVNVVEPEAATLEDALFIVGLQDKSIPFDVQVVRNNEIHISETTLALLMDLPFMEVDSPAFNIKLDKWLKIRLRNNIVNASFVRTSCDVDKMRAEWIEQFALLHSNPKQLFEQLKSPDETLDTVIKAYVANFESDIMNLIDVVTERLRKLQAPSPLGGKGLCRGELTSIVCDLSRDPTLYGETKGVLCMVDESDSGPAGVNGIINRNR